MRLPLILTALLCLAIPAQAETQDAVTISDVYSYATAGKQKHGAVFFTLHHQAPDDRLMKAETEVSDITELHTHIMEGEVMKMRKVEALDIPDNGHLELKPRADHIMLIGLKKQLVEGETFPLTLTFEKAGARVIEVPIIKAGTMPAGKEAGHHHEGAEHGHHTDY